MKTEFILASPNPIKADMLRRNGISVVMVGMPLELSNERLWEQTMNRLNWPLQLVPPVIAYQKAIVVANYFDATGVIGNDVGKEVLGVMMTKPRNTEEAVNQILFQSGQSVRQIGGTGVIMPDGRNLVGTEITLMSLREITLEEARAWVADNENVALNTAGTITIHEPHDFYCGEMFPVFRTIYSDNEAKVLQPDEIYIGHPDYPSTIYGLSTKMLSALGIV